MTSAIPRPEPDPAGPCMYCHEDIDLDGDNWREIPFLDMLSLPHLRLVHMECYTRALTGDIFHLAEMCSCFGSGERQHDDRPWRQQSRSVRAFFRLRVDHSDLPIPELVMLAYYEGNMEQQE